MVQAEDPDHDPITYTYQWLKNEREMVGETLHVLKSGSFKKGDIIQIKILPSDGKAEGKPYLSDPVKILNAPPLLNDVRIEPRIPTSSDDLKAIVKASDPDGDFIYFTYRWEKNGTPIQDEDKEILKKTRFKKGDSIA
ncbi:MAG: hypothetical protein N3G78_14610, partial [Desulfobacterota bacterium]|nr:hypothetical protein [Thermodesulfobacteriota bacterium]